MTSATKRFATAITIALALLAAVPVSAVCCVGQSAAKTATMSSMPCCAETCTMSSPKVSRDHDVTLIPAPAPQPAATTVTTLITPAVVISVASAVAVLGPVNDSSPPSFLINAQFRI